MLEKRDGCHFIPGLTAPTEREIRFLQMVADGYEYTEIAVVEKMTLASVKNLASLVCKKLGADNSRQAIAMGMRRGLIK